MKAVILAGGLGTRLRAVIGDETPKPMALIAGKPFLEHQIRLLKKQGLEDIVLAVHHRAGMIKTFFGNGRRHGVNIAYAEEEIPLGTAGAIKNAQGIIGDERFMVLNGDTYAGIKFEDFLRFHDARGRKATMAVTEAGDPQHQEVVEIENGLAVRFHERGKCPAGIVPMINSGAYIFESEIFKRIDPGKNVSLEREVFPNLVEQRALAAFPYAGYFMDIGRPETYGQFKRDIIGGWLMRGENSIREALGRMGKNEEGLVFVVDEKERLIGVVTRAFIDQAFIDEKADLGDCIKKIMQPPLAVAHEGDSPEKIAEIMLPRTNRLPILNADGQIVDMVYRQEVIEIADAPVFRAISPLRISFSGGGTDKEDYFTQFGTGIVINATIDKYCHATARMRHDSLIRINPGQENEEVLDLRKRKLEYGGQWDLAKAVINTMKPDFGFDLHVRNDVPPGRGLGSSGSFAVMLTELLTQMRRKYLTNDQVAEIARRAEVEELKIGGGWQDQYAAKVGGFNLIEFSAGRIIPSSLALSPEVVSELEESLVLCYVGKTHNSGEVHRDQEKHFAEEKEKVRRSLEHLKDIAIRIRDSLVSKNPARIRDLGDCLHEAWALKRELGGSITNPEIDRLYDVGRMAGATGGKLLGAGNGGYVLFFVPPEKRYSLVKSISAYTPEILDFKFERQPVGTRVWSPRI